MAAYKFLILTASCLLMTSLDKPNGYPSFLQNLPFRHLPLGLSINEWNFVETAARDHEQFAVIRTNSMFWANASIIAISNCVDAIFDLAPFLHSCPLSSNLCIPGTCSVRSAWIQQIFTLRQPQNHEAVSIACITQLPLFPGLTWQASDLSPR